MPIFHGLACHHVASAARHELQKKRHMMCIICLCSCCASPHRRCCLPPQRRRPLPLPLALRSSSPNCLSHGPLSGALSSTRLLPSTAVWLQNQNCFCAASVACVHALQIITTSSSPSPCGSAGRPVLTATPPHLPPRRPCHCLYHLCRLCPPAIAPSLSVIVILLVNMTKTSTTIPPGRRWKTRTKTRLLSQQCRPVLAVIPQSAWCSVVVPSVVCRPHGPSFAALNPSYYYSSHVASAAAVLWQFTLHQILDFCGLGHTRPPPPPLAL